MGHPANTNNQLTTCGLTYDAAGNAYINNGVTYTYDAENRLVTPGANNGTYLYDGDGNRMARLFSSSGTEYWRDLSGNTLLEDSNTGVNLREYIYFAGKKISRRDVVTNNVHYVFSDHLGSSSIITDALGTMASCNGNVSGQFESDYFPYGGEMSICNNVGDQNYKFTGKERDSESGLDNFGARYNASSLGRFQTADPFNPLALEPSKLQAWMSNPQRWNKYSYALNNPATLIDPDGLNACGTKDDSKCIVRVFVVDRSKDKKGNYNDQFKNVKGQEGYNATAHVFVSNLETGKTTDAGTFLARTEPSDTGQFPTTAAGGYEATLTQHNGHLALRLQPTDHIPITNGANPAHPDRDYATGILVHISGLNNATGMTRAGGGISEGCVLVCRSQYSGFLDAVGATADPPQRHFGVMLSATPNMQPGEEREDDDSQ